MKDPAFLFYYKDFENDTADWEADAVGWYLRLLIFQAGNGYVPSEIEELAQVARVRYSEFKIFSERWAYRLACKFQPLSEGRIYNKELSKIQAERKTGAIKKSVLAVFGNFIKSTELTDTELKDLKRSFHSQNHFLEILNAEIRKDEIVKFLNNEIILIKNNNAKRYAERSHMQSERNKAIANAIAIENINEDVIEIEKEKKRKFTKNDFKKILIDLGSDETHVADWLQVRADKKASNTETALKTFVNECNKHNYPVASAVQVCAENSWAGFKYEWLNNLKNNSNANRSSNNAGSNTTDFSKVIAGIDAMYGPK